MDITIDVNGMTCGGCVRSVKQVLEAIPGVTHVEVSLERRQANISFDPKLTGIEQFRDAIVQAGYEA
jgi:copper chaperone